MKSSPREYSRVRGRSGWDRLKHRTPLLALGALLGLLAVSFYVSQIQPTPPTVGIDGSSTVFPITQAVAEEFAKAHSDIRVNVAFSGTGGGFRRFTRGETDVNDASRPIKDSEAALAEDNGVQYLELRIAIDGLAVVVNPANTWCDCITVAELARLWHPDATAGQPGEIVRWNQIRAEWPDRPITLYGKGTDSGTFDYFTKVIEGEEGLSRADYVASTDNNVLALGIAGDVNGLGYFGVAYYEANIDRLKVVSVDSGAGCLKPTRENILSGVYTPLARPLFIYVNTARNNQSQLGSLQRPEVYEFVKFFQEIAKDTNAIQEVGYVEYHPEQYVENLRLIGAAAEPPLTPLSSPHAAEEAASHDPATTLRQQRHRRFLVWALESTIPVAQLFLCGVVSGSSQTRLHPAISQKKIERNALAAERPETSPQR